MQTILASLFALLAFMLSGALAQVSVAVKTGKAETRLAAETVTAAAGEAVTLAVMQELEEHWHVYWRNPGDSGLPLTLEWSLPDGFEAGEIQYPTPLRLPFGPLTNYGHEGSPTFLIPIRVPADVVPGTSFPISVKADWLICYDICIPEGATLRLVLTIAEVAGQPTPVYGARIAAARAALPTPLPFEATYFDGPRGPVLRLAETPSGMVDFFPYAPAVNEPSAPFAIAPDGDGLLIEMQAGFAYGAKKPTQLGGVLTIGSGPDRRGFELFAPRVAAPTGDLRLIEQPRGELRLGSNAADRPQTAGGGGVGATALVTLGLALIGGLILNVMPCVFPIVFLKAAGFASLPREARGTIRRHGLLYTAGVLAAFAALAGTLMVLRAGGEGLGWGFHLQSPIAVGIFAIVVFLIGLNLAGLFEAGGSLQRLGDGTAHRGGNVGAFMTGLLAVAVAAPCIGPFLGGAVGVALTQGPGMGMAIFLAIGLGLALPYLLISLVPVLGQLLPRPGQWMVTMRQLFSFAMFGTLVWLAWVIAAQTGEAGVLRLGVALLAAGFAAWLFGRTQRGQGGIVSRLLAAAALVGAGVPLADLTVEARTVTASTTPEKLPTVAFSPAALSDLRAAGRPVFVDFTAAWCITCQVNKRTVLETKPVIDAFHATDTLYMVADWTVRDPVITAALEQQGRAGVPLYLYYRPGAEAPVVLPQILTQRLVLDAIGAP